MLEAFDLNVVVDFGRLFHFSERELSRKPRSREKEF
jgi:hypothetical protein